MQDTAKRLARALLCLIPVFCASCFGMTLPKGGSVEPASAAANRPVPPSDKRIVDTWELLYRVNDKGEEERPRDSTRTLIDFTDKGKIIFNRMDKERSDRVATHTGIFTTENAEVRIVDESGNGARWPYQITGDTLELYVPEEKKKFFWRRFR
jgi:hypothetical protein